MINNGNRGDFVGIWSRANVDTHLLNSFRTSWSKIADFPKILALEPKLTAREPSGASRRSFSTFFRSDHAAFWYHKAGRAYGKTLEAILVSDWGPWRGYQRQCYHKKCDDQTQLTTNNLRFLKKIIDTIVSAMYEMSTQ